MRAEPVRDPHGDLIAAQEQADRAAERADSPKMWLPNAFGLRLNRYDDLPEPDRSVLRERADGR